MEGYQLELETYNYRDYAKFLYDKNIITKEEWDSIFNMINSPDKENFTIAKIILDGLNIPSKES